MRRNRSSSFGFLTLAVIFIAFCSLCAVEIESRATCEHRTAPTPNEGGDYDFIVAGGGTGGAIVAARLSENFHVLLLESGERLFDDAKLSAKYLMPVMLGTDISSVVNTLSPFIKAFGSLTSSGDIYDDKGKKIGSLTEGIPGFMPHIQATPFLAVYMTMTEATHYYPTVPQIYSQKREIDYPRGNVLGGSSAANTMVYYKGSSRDYDQWRDEFGLKGWGYRDILPYLRKFENSQDVSDTKVHGHGGPINITIVKNHFPSPASDAWTEAALKLGWPKIEDASNPETQYGASDSWQSFVGADGKRSDTTEYIKMMERRGKVCWDKPRSECLPSQTLHIWTSKFVTKVLIDENKRAYGVQYIEDPKKERARSPHPSKSFDTNEGVKHHKPYNKWDRLEVQAKEPKLGAPVDKSLAFDYSRTSDQYIPETISEAVLKAKTVTAKYEVILSTGAVTTGQLLMLSGIGPVNHLHERGIPVVYDLPVGQRMQDHQEAFIQYKYPSDFKPAFDFVTEAMHGFPTIRAHLRGERTFFSANGVPAGLEGSSDGPNGKIPKWHLHHITMGAFENFDYNLAVYPESVTTPYRLPRGLVELFRWKGLYMHQHNCELSQNHAYGRLELRNRDPLQPPFLDPRYGSSDEDNAEIVNCIQTVREIMKHTDPKYVGEELGPSAEAVTKEQLTQFVRNSVWGHHISGSAPMGNCTTDFAVTDERARIYGVDGLRVCDISLLPTIPHGNPAGVVMMMAEKIADMIKQDYNSPIDETFLKDEL